MKPEFAELEIQPKAFGTRRAISKAFGTRRSEESKNPDRRTNEAARRTNDGAS
jgi:hypothetical protein